MSLAGTVVAAVLCVPVWGQQKPENGGWIDTATLRHEHPVNIVACNSDWIATGDEGGNLFVGDAKTGKDLELRAKGGQQEGFNRSVDHLRFAPDGKKLYAVLHHGRSMSQFHLPRNPKGPYDGGVSGEDPLYLGYSPDVLTWLERHVGNAVLALRPSPWMPRAPGSKVYESIEYEAEVSHAVISADNQWVGVVTADAKLHIHDRASLREIHTIALTRQAARDIQFSLDGKRIAVCGEQSFARVYDTESGKEFAALQGHRGIVFSVAFSPDGMTIATGGDDSTARIWEAATGKPLAVLEGHNDSVKSIAFAPSGDMLVTGSADKTAKVWRTKP